MQNIKVRTVYARISDIKAGIDEDGVTLGNYSGKMAELGINVLDMNGNLRDMGEVMEEIGGKWGDLTREQQVYLAQTMAGQRQYNNLLALFDNFEQYNKALATAQGAAGTLQEQQDIYMESTAAHLEVLRASVEDIYDSLADTDSINGLIDGLSTAATFASNLIDGLGGGEAVLKALGSIGITVFSEQIAKGLNTTITNLEIGKDNARQFDQALQATKNWQGIPGLDKTSQDLLKNREQLLELARLMTPDQFAGMQTLLNNITTLGNEIKEIQSKLDPLKNTLKDFTDTSLMDVLGNEKEIDNIINKIDDPIDSLEKLQQKVKDTKDAFRDSFGKASILLGKSGVNTFDEVFDEAQVKITSFLNTLHDLKGTDAFKGLSDEAKVELDKIDIEWDELLSKLNTMTPEESSQAFKAFFDRLSQVATTSSDEIQRKYEELLGVLNDPTIVTSLEQKQQQLRKMVNDFVTGQERMQRAAKIENYAKMAGGIAQVGSAIQQVQNLGSIWKNENLTTGQKLLQIITNLAISLPMLATGFTKATTALGLMKTMTTAEAVAAGISTSAQAAHAISIGRVATESGAAAIKVQLLNTTLLVNPFVVVAAGVLALVARLGALQKAYEKNQQAIKENQQAIIDEQDKKQQQIDKNNQLLDSLEDLNLKYSDGQLTRSELKTEIEKLTEQYGLEKSAVDELAGSYDNLDTYIKQHRKTEAEENLKSLKREKENREKLFKEAFLEEDSNEADKNLTLSLFEDPGRQEASSIISDILEQAGFKDLWYDESSNMPSGMEALTVSTDLDTLLETYDKLIEVKEVIEKAAEENPDLELTSGDIGYYADLMKLIDKMDPYISSLRETNDLYQETAQNLNAISAAENISFDPSKIQNINDYIKAMQALEDEIQRTSEKELSPEQLQNQAQIYLRNNAKTIYNQYDQLADYILQLENKFKSIDENVVSILGELTPEQLSFIEDIQLKDISNWEDLQHIIEYLSTADLSNFKTVTDPEAALEEATSQYNLYNSLSNQISDSKKQTINKKEYENLAPEVQNFFTMMANGQYKMTGDAKEFYDTVNNLSLEGFKKNIADLEASNKRLQELQGIDFNKLSQSAMITGRDSLKDFREGYSQKDVDNQLDFLTEVGYNTEQIAKWKAELSDGDAVVSTYVDIANAVKDYSNQTDKLSTYLQANQDAIYQNQLAIARSTDSFKTLKQYLDEGLISEQAFTQAAIELDAALDTKNLDSEELEDYADHLQQIAKQSDELSDELEDNEDAAKIVAKGIMKMNDAVKKLADNWEDWSDILKNSSNMSEEYTNAMGDTRETIADLLDISKDYVSEDFIKDHLDEIAKAATGSGDAIDALKSSLAEDIVTRIMVENGIDETTQAQVLSDIANLQAMIPNIEVGATIDDGDFLNKAQKLIEDCGMTVEQANAVFDALGFEANFATEEQKVVQRVPKTVTKTEVTGYTSGTSTDPAGQPIDWSYPILAQWSYNDGFAEEEGTIDVPAMATNGKTPVINSLTRKAGGGSNNYSSSNRGGNPSSQPSSGGRGGKGGGSKGSGKGNEPDKSQKDRKKAMEDTRDIYHDINVELGQIDRKLTRVQKKQDALYGKQLLDNLNKQQKLLEKHKETLKEKQAIQQQDLKSQQDSLKNLDVTFDKYGNITNYMDILGRRQSEINAKTKEYNSLIDAYNTSTDQDIKKQIAEKAEALNKQIKNMQDEYKDLEDKIKRYDGLREDMEEVADNIEQETQKQIEIEIKKFRMNIEIKLDMGEAQRDWNQFRREVLEHTDILKDSNFSGISRDSTQNLRDIRSYFNINGSRGSLQTLIDQLLDTRQQIENINKLGNSAIYGDNKAQAMKHLQQDLKELMSQMEDVQSLIDNIDEAYLDTVEDITDQFDKQIDDYNFIGDLIEHNMDLLSLLYGDNNYDAMNKYYSALQENNLKTLDSLKKQRDFWKQQWDEAVQRGDTQAAKRFEENYRNTLSNLNQTIEDAASNLQNKYTNAINKIFDELDKRISKGKGTDFLSDDWELMNKNADEYLDTINAAFGIQQTERKYNQALKEAKSIKNQQALKQLMDEQLNILENKEKVTQYDIDRAEKLLQIEQARIALEQARSSKTSMRLKRDAQGNYSYEYTADDASVDDAAANLANAQNDLYNFDKERYKSNLNDMISAWQEFKEKYIQIVLDVNLTEEERIAKKAQLEEAYGEYINGKTEQNYSIRDNLMQSAFASMAEMYRTDVENYNQMSNDEKNILMNDLVPAWDSGIQQMTDKFAGEGGFIPTCEQAFDNIIDVTKDYQNELDQMASTADINLSQVKAGVDDTSDSMSDLIVNNSELISQMHDELSAISLIKAEAHALILEYQRVYDAAKLAISGINSFIQAQQRQAMGETQESGVSGGGNNDSEINSGSNNSNTSNSSSSNSSNNSKSGAKNANRNVEQPDEDLIEGIAGNIWVYETWGNDPYRHNNIIAKFGKERGEKIYRAVQAKFNSGYGYNGGLQHNWEYYKKYSLSSFRSGGYTGSWAGNEGRIGVLHQKQMVLNSQDTSNLLNTVSILRSVMSSLGGTVNTRMNDFKSTIRNTLVNGNNSLEQAVHIEASFPNVNSKREIEEALSELVNLAAQRAMRR